MGGMNGATAGRRNAGRWLTAPRRLLAVPVGTMALAIGVWVTPVAPAPRTALPVPARAPGSGSGRPAPDASAPDSRGSATENSVDWAGYAVTGAVTSVAGSWTEPAVGCPGTKLEQSAFWVGIDGFATGDDTVEQIGTDADCTKGTKKDPGGPSYYAWYELFPGPLVTLAPASYPVSPGDVLSARVTVVTTGYALSISDDNSHWSYSSTQPSSGQRNASAEWITEAPSTCKSATSCKVVPLADFGSVNFSGVAVQGLPLASSGLTPQQLDMTKTKNGKDLEASTSALSSSGSFTVDWVSP